MKITISPIKTSIENWLICIIISESKTATGYGTTHMNALEDAIRDYKLIKKLNK